jgi:uncharacterized RDD family membrane protein YckC
VDITATATGAELDDSLYATWSRRAGAWALDAVLLVAATESILAVSDIAGSLAAVLLAPAYATVCHGSRRGQSAGKRLVGISVRDATSLGRVGYPRALWRWLVATTLWLLLVIPGLLDVLWPLGDRRRQTWHDKASRTVVVRL